MTCLLAAATPFEIAPFLENMRQQTAGIQPIDVLITGIGLTASTYSLQKQIHLKRPDLIIQAGIGGCFDPKTPLGKVVAIQKDTIADQSVMEKGELMTLFDLKLVKPDQFPYKRGWLTNPSKELLKRSNLKAVTAISVNHITSKSQMIELYRQHFSPTIESMEGAALHYTCLMEQIPFIQLRAVSNYVGERNKKRWKIKEAIENLNKELLQFVKLQ
jgi:futalosine hydrolase